MREGGLQAALTALQAYVSSQLEGLYVEAAQMVAGRQGGGIMSVATPVPNASIEPGEVDTSDFTSRGYWDVNFTFGYWVGVSVGRQYSNSGPYYYNYRGAGVMAPGPGLSVTYSPLEAGAGWTAAIQISLGLTGQFGIFWPSDPFQSWSPVFEVGLGTPGVSYTVTHSTGPYSRF
jgi:hypothetical protein